MTGSLCGTLLFVFGAVAQWSEQGTHNPRVVGSIPTRPTSLVVRASAGPAGSNTALPQPHNDDARAMPAVRIVRYRRLSGWQFFVVRFDVGVQPVKFCERGVEVVGVDPDRSLQARYGRNP